MAMEWVKLLTSNRFGKTLPEKFDVSAIRSEFQRDYDRIIFSSPFRRLQNKTQVFPLPGSIFVHNRLTHSLEVASIGRSLGNLVARELKQHQPEPLWPLLDEIGTIVSVASLAHDLGNPPFGHSGEDAISGYFKEGKGKELQNLVTETQWDDLTHFEGNANALRLLTHQFNGRRKGGFVLTYASLSALVKYPFSSADMKKNKYGYFQTEKEIFDTIAQQTGLKVLDPQKGIYARNPLVYLVEAADDIAYLVMDIEDAHKLGILSESETKEILNSFFDGSDKKAFIKKQNEVFLEVTDVNEQIAFLRASAINRLANETAKVFIQNISSIMEGDFEGALIKHLPNSLKESMEQSSRLSTQKIYRNRAVVEVEITGHNVLSTLVEEFTSAILQPQLSYSKKLIALMPSQYQYNGDDPYLKIRSVLDFISGMTDLYALDLYKLIKGIGSNSLVVKI
jgi:dGTPase